MAVVNVCLLYLLCLKCSIAFQYNLLRSQRTQYTLKTGGLSEIPNSNVDISDVMAEIEGALQSAQEALPQSSSSSSSSIENDIADIAALQRKMEQLELENYQNTAPSQGEFVASSVLAKSAMNVVLGVGKALEFAQEQIEAEDDLTKIPQKVMNVVQTKANETYQDFRTGRTFQDLLAYLNSEEFKKEAKDLKDLSEKAFMTVKAGLESDEMKSFQKQTVKAMKDGWESDERKELQRLVLDANKKKQV